MIGVDFSENLSQNAFKFDTKRGIAFGDKTRGDMKTNLQFWCSNATTSEELALEMEMDIEIVLNATV